MVSTPSHFDSHTFLLNGLFVWVFGRFSRQWFLATIGSIPSSHPSSARCPGAEESSKTADPGGMLKASVIHAGESGGAEDAVFHGSARRINAVAGRQGLF